MARHKDQDSRRAELAAATRRAVIARGIDGVRLKDVAEQAGLTSAAVLYYYDGVDELVTETYRQAIDRFSRLREEAAARHEDARDGLVSCIDSGIADGPEDELVRLLVELIPRSLRDPAVAAMDRELYDRQEAVYQTMLTRGQEQRHFNLTAPPAELAASFVAMEDGFQLEILAGRKSREAVIAHITAFAHAVTGCDLAANTVRG
jgi:AcrR family transcriptional regulator